MELIVRILLWAVLLSYAAFIIVRRIKKIKRGEYCDCCDGSCSCGRPKKPKHEKL